MTRKTLSEQIAALSIDVKTVEDENVKLQNALAQRDSELFALKAKPQPTVASAVRDVAKSGRTVTLKTTPVQTLQFNRSSNANDGSLEDDVRKFLGLSPHESSKCKNDKHFIAKLDKAYGAAAVDAMIKQLRGA